MLASRPILGVEGQRTGGLALAEAKAAPGPSLPPSALGSPCRRRLLRPRPPLAPAAGRWPPSQAAMLATVSRLVQRLRLSASYAVISCKSPLDGGRGWLIEVDRNTRPEVAANDAAYPSACHRVSEENEADGTADHR